MRLEFILVVPGRCYGDFVDRLAPFHTAHCANAKQEVLGEVSWNQLKLIIAHDLHVALEVGAKRDSRIQALEQCSSPLFRVLKRQFGFVKVLAIAA